MKILAIRFARLGDVILLLPALRSLKAAFPESQLTFLTGHRCAPIAELCSDIDEVVSVDRVAIRDGPVLRALKEMMRLSWDIRGRRFDLVVDFHSFRETNVLTRISGAPARVAMKRYKAPYLSWCFNRPPVLEDKNLHVADMFQKVVEEISGLPPAGIRPGLAIPGDLQEWAGQIVPGGPKLALYVDAPVPERIWPAKRFAEVADFAVEKLGATVLVLSGREGAAKAQLVEASSRNPRSMYVVTDVTIPKLAALIKSARLLVSNDTGPMHIGPAVGTATLGLFSVGYPEHFRPIGPNNRFLRGNPIGDLKTNAVIEMVEQLWATADPDLRR